MSDKFAQFTIRLSKELNDQATDKAKTLGVPRSEVVRRALNKFCNAPSPNEDSISPNKDSISPNKDSISPNKDSNREEDLLKIIDQQNCQLEAYGEARTRSDTIIMQLTQQLERSQLQIGDLTKPKTVWQRLRTAFS